MKIQFFGGHCLGVELRPRAAHKQDDHIEMALMVEDDGKWSEKEAFSSYWIDELISQLQAAKIWLQQNAVPDVPEDGIQYGWRFKK